MTLREDYNRDGYVKCSGLYIGDVSSWNELSFFTWFSGSRDAYMGLLRKNAKCIGIQQQFLQVCVLETLSYLIIGDFKISSDLIMTEQPVLHVMSPALRIPDGYYGTAAHQDWPSTQGSLDCVTVWIALTDAGIGNFPVEVIPGSHKRGLLDGKINGSVLEVEADDREFVPIECKAGDVVFLSGFTVHRTGNGTGFRVAVSQRFDNAAEPTFIERGYPCAQKRVVDRGIKWRPTQEQVAQVFA